MIKGCSRKIYHVRNLAGKYFDEVYFILKDGAPESVSVPPASTLAEEADRIIKEAASSFEPKNTRRAASVSRLLAFLTGVFTSSAILGIIAFLLTLQ